jgi:hypothetical protein
MSTKLSTAVFLASFLALRSGWASDQQPTATHTLIEWRWGPGTDPHHCKAAKPFHSSLFEENQKWGWKEWAIIGGGVAAIAAIVVVATSGSHGSGSGGSGRGY